MSRSLRFAPAALAAALGLSSLATSSDAGAIDRAEVMARARAFALHPWRAATPNLTASCNPAYQSVYVPGDYVGLPYDWGGYMPLFEFDQDMDAGLGAGSYPDDGILACTSGLDCSGFVSQAWGTGHFTTSSLDETSNQIGMGSMLPGDVFNEAGFHVAMLQQLLSNGVPIFVEAIGYNVHYNATGGLAHVDGYIPRRLTSITGTNVVEPTGTPFNPIVVSSFPYADSRNTLQSSSDLFDGCGISPTKNESGREFVYQVTFAQPGSLTATVTDDAGVDIDVHVYTSTNTSDCFARNDATVTVNVDCGTYLVVADTFRSANGDQAGAYTLNMSFSPSGAACGSGPVGYSPEGQLGDACAYPSNENLPFCNPNLGVDTCLYSSNSSFCSKPCASAADCAGIAGGCCGDIGAGELYCLTSAFCSGDPPPDQGQTTGGGDPTDPVTTGSGGGATASGSGGATGSGGAAGTGTGSGPSGDGNATDGEETGGGCAVGPGVPAGGLSWVGAALALVALRRRRRTI